MDKVSRRLTVFFEGMSDTIEQAFVPKVVEFPKKKQA